MKTRELKVHEHSTMLKGKNRHSFKPKIILCGKWLQDAGIFAGDRVQITILKDKIIINA